ncbi:MAG: ankyrin repeat domain-containing protein, partial [Verrucomicrobiota bacterium]|nr:ankyrin repeat domain-containing protein [Verrucomicrobiota bacterium]
KVNNEVVKLLIAKGANVNAISKHGRTPLDFAIMRGQEEAVETLRKHGGKTGVELKAAQPDPPTAKAPAISIHDAATEGNIEAVRQHLAAGTDVNAKLGGRTSLHLAAYEGHKAIAALLISEGGNINAKSDVNGGTPLHAAAFGGRTEIVELLIANGADVNAKYEIGFTPLYIAAQNGQKEIAKLLIANGADV